MRDWATCGTKVLTKGVGRSCVLIHEKTFFLPFYCIKIQIYDEVRKDLGNIGAMGRECGMGFQQQFGLISVTEARLCLACHMFSSQVPTISNASSKILFARDSEMCHLRLKCQFSAMSMEILELFP